MDAKALAIFFFSIFAMSETALSSVDGSYDPESDLSKPIPGYIYDVSQQIVPMLSFPQKTDVLIVGFAHVAPSGVPISLSNQVLSLKGAGFTDLILELGEKADNCRDLFRMSEGLFPLDHINYPNVSGIGGKSALEMIKVFKDNGFNLICGDVEDVQTNGVQFHTRNLKFAERILKLNSEKRAPILLIGFAHPPALEAILTEKNPEIRVRIYDASQQSGVPLCKGVKYPYIDNSCKPDPGWPLNNR